MRVVTPGDDGVSVRAQYRPPRKPRYGGASLVRAANSSGRWEGTLGPDAQRTALSGPFGASGRPIRAVAAGGGGWVQTPPAAAPPASVRAAPVAGATAQRRRRRRRVGRRRGASGRPRRRRRPRAGGAA